MKYDHSITQEQLIEWNRFNKTRTKIAEAQKRLSTPFNFKSLRDLGILTIGIFIFIVWMTKKWDYRILLFIFPIPIFVYISSLLLHIKDVLTIRRYANPENIHENQPLLRRNILYEWYTTILHNSIEKAKNEDDSQSKNKRLLLIMMVVFPLTMIALVVAFLTNRPILWAPVGIGALGLFLYSGFHGISIDDVIKPVININLVTSKLQNLYPDVFFDCFLGIDPEILVNTPLFYGKIQKHIYTNNYFCLKRSVVLTYANISFRESVVRWEPHLNEERRMDSILQERSLLVVDLKKPMDCDFLICTKYHPLINNDVVESQQLQKIEGLCTGFFQIYANNNAFTLDCLPLCDFLKNEMALSFCIFGKDDTVLILLDKPLLDNRNINEENVETYFSKLHAIVEATMNVCWVHAISKSKE